MIVVQEAQIFIDENNSGCQIKIGMFSGLFLTGFNQIDSNSQSQMKGYVEYIGMSLCYFKRQILQSFENPGGLN
jgi:hypothetical protein